MQIDIAVTRFNGHCTENSKCYHQRFCGM